MEKNIIILGGGPAGYHCALSCREKGFAVTLIEQADIGGTCTHKGCIPTRGFLDTIKAKHQLLAASPSLAPALTLNPKELADTVSQKIQQLAWGMDYTLRKKKVTLIQDTARITGEHEITLSNGSILTCDALIVATGAKPVVPTQHKFQKVYSDAQLLSMEQLPQKLSIVGGGVLGIELAVILNELGCSVTILERETRLLPSWDEDISTHIAAYLERLGINLSYNIKEVSGEAGVFCIGREPNLPEIADHVNISADWLHIIGDAAGGIMTADKAILQGSQMGAHLSGEDAIPAGPWAKCLFTPLEAAEIGENAGVGDIVAYQDIGYTPSGVLFSTDLGFIKVVIDKTTHRLKGFFIVSHMASELISMGQIALAQNMTAEEFSQMRFPHPTEGELLIEAVKSVCRN